MHLPVALIVCSKYCQIDGKIQPLYVKGSLTQIKMSNLTNQFDFLGYCSNKQTSLLTGTKLLTQLPILLNWWDWTKHAKSLIGFWATTQTTYHHKLRFPGMAKIRVLVKSGLNKIKQCLKSKQNIEDRTRFFQDGTNLTKLNSDRNWFQTLEIEDNSYSK